jgi:uncharacterized UBP type Zn finger protein
MTDWLPSDENLMILFLYVDWLQNGDGHVLNVIDYAGHWLLQMRHPTNVEISSVEDSPVAVRKHCYQCDSNIILSPVDKNLQPKASAGS